MRISNVYRQERREWKKGVITANYEVIRFIEHGNLCHPTMDCVKGELLIHRIRRCQEIDKTLLFTWFKELMLQIEKYHRCRNNQCYRYINPYSVLVTKDEQILLLDLDAESNAFVLKNMQKRAMREHFVKPIIHVRENTKVSLDLYGYAKTIQFILAGTKVQPSLTGWEERRLAKLIGKCLNENPRSQYEDLKQVEKELPVIRKKRNIGKGMIIAIACILFGSAIFFHFYMQRNVSVPEEQVKKEKQARTVNQNPDREKVSEETEGEETNEAMDGLDSNAEEIHALEQFLLENTVKGNQEVIRRGETLHREVLRYLAPAYDRENMKEQALQSYQELCTIENHEGYLETTYIRRISLEMELYQYGKEAVETGKAAMERLPSSEELAKKYVEALCVCKEMEREEKAAEIRALAERFSGVKELECYMKWEEEQNGTEEKENVGSYGENHT